MSKYSSDSDSSEDSRYQKRKSKRRSRSSSSSSNDSRYSSKKRSYKHKRSKGHRSRSRDKYSKSRSRHSRDESSRSTFGSRSSSKAKHSKSSRDRSRSSSRDRSSGRRKHRSKRYSRSPSKGRSKYRSSSSSSNGKSRSRSNSPVCIDSRTTSQAGSAKQEPSSEEQLRAKLQQAIKAAQSADDLLRQQGFLTGVSSRKEEIIKEPATSVLDEINNPSFIPKNFVSQSSIPFTSEATTNLAVKLASVPPSATSANIKDSATSIFHPSLLVDPEQKLDKWVKKLFNLRQKAINGEPIA